MSSMISAISYFYVNNTYDDFEIEMDKFVQEYYLNKKKTLKKEINTVLDILNYNVKKSNLNDEELKADAIKLLNNITFEENTSNYFFVYEVKNMEGGDDFAKLLGKTKIDLFSNDGIIRIKSSIFHPMETGLMFGNSAFYINKIVLKADDKNISEIKTYSAISENPRFIFETKTKAQNYKIEFFDIDGNQFSAQTK